MQPPPRKPSSRPPQLKRSHQLECAEVEREWKPIVLALIAIILFAILLIALLFSRWIPRGSGGVAGAGTGNQEEKEYRLGHLAKEGDSLSPTGEGAEEGAKGKESQAATSQSNISSLTLESTAGENAKEAAGIASEVPAGNVGKDGTNDSAESDVVGLDQESQDNPTAVLPIRIARSASRNPAGNGASILQNGQGENPLVEAAGDGKVIFVIDCSGSMSGTPLERVKQSLCDAIELLDEEQLFTVYFFDSGVYFAPTGPAMIVANAKNKNEMIEWIAQPRGGGGTYPLEAIYTALNQKPDRIVVLSDGEFDPRIVEMVSRENNALRNPIRIDCIGLAESIQTLQELARRNGKGIYYQAR